MANTVASVFIDFDARTRGAGRDITVLATRLRALRTTAIATGISILASSGVAAGGIAIISTAAGAAALALGSLSVVGGAALGFLAMKAQADSERVQSAFAKMKDEVTSDWKEMTSEWEPILFDLIQKSRNAWREIRDDLEFVLDEFAPIFRSGMDKFFEGKGPEIFAESVRNTFENMRPFLSGFTDLFVPMVQGFGEMNERAAAGLGKGAPGILQGFRDVFLELLPAIGTFLGKLNELAGRALPAVIGLFVDIFEGFSPLIDGLTQSSFLEDFFEGLGDGLKGFLNAVNILMQELGPGLGDVFRSLGRLFEAVAKPLAGIGGTFETLLEGLVTVIDTIGPALGDLSGLFGEIVETFAGPVVDFFTAVAPPFIEALRALIEALRPMIQPLGEMVTAFLKMATPIVISFLEAVTRFIEQNPRKIQAIAEAFLMIAFASQIVAGAMFVWTLLSAGIAAVMGPITLVTAALVGIGVFLFNLQRDNEDLREALGAIWDGIVSIFETAKNKVSEFFDGMMKPLREFESFFREKISPLFGDLWEAIQEGEGVGEAIRNIFAGIGEFDFSMLIDPALEILRGLPDRIMGFLETAVELVAEYLPEIVRGIATKIPEMLRVGLELFGTLLEALTDVLPDLLPEIVDTIVEIFHSIVDMIPDLVDIAVEFFSALLDATVIALPLIIDGAVDLILAVLEAILEHGPTLIRGAVELFLGILDGLIQALPDILDGILDLIGGIIRLFSENAGEFVAAGVEILIALIEGLTEALPQILDFIVEEFFPAIIDFLTEEKNLERILNAGSEVLMAVLDGIEEVLPMLLDFFINDMIPQIVTLLIDNAPEIAAAGFAFVTELMRAFNRYSALLGYYLLFEFVPGILRGVWDALFEAGRSLGEALGAGMIDALEDAVVELILWLKTNLPRISIPNPLNWFDTGGQPEVKSPLAPKVPTKDPATEWTEGQIADAKRYSAQARAGGGPVTAGGMYLVGEKGPEFWSPSRSGTIIPASLTAVLTALEPLLRSDLASLLRGPANAAEEPQRPSGAATGGSAPDASPAGSPVFNINFNGGKMREQDVYEVIHRVRKIALNMEPFNGV